MGDTGQDKRVERFGSDEDVASAAAAKRQDAKDARVRMLRSKAAVARSEVDAIEAMHLDPDTLEDLLESSSPLEARRLEKSEHAISQRVAKAMAAAEAAENEYEQAVLEQYDDSKT
jgi:hypothetical protein